MKTDTKEKKILSIFKNIFKIKQTITIIIMIIIIIIYQFDCNCNSCLGCSPQDSRAPNDLLVDSCSKSGCVDDDEVRLHQCCYCCFGCHPDSYDDQTLGLAANTHKRTITTLSLTCDSSVQLFGNCSKNVCHFGFHDHPAMNNHAPNIQTFFFLGFLIFFFFLFFLS